MDKLSKLTEEMRQSLDTNYDSLPDLDLYMDQVLAYLSRTNISFRAEDKLTSAMVNNYKKSGLMPGTPGKKYNRTHLVYLTLIARLKQVLSVKDVDILLKEDMKNVSLREYYAEFLGTLDSSFEELYAQIEDLSEEELSKTAMKLALSAYTSKIACQYIIDLIEEKNAPAKDEREIKKEAKKEAKREAKEQKTEQKK